MKRVCFFLLQAEIFRVGFVPSGSLMATDDTECVTVRLDATSPTSPVWMMACGWRLQFVRIADSARHPLQPGFRHFAKVLLGTTVVPPIPSNVAAPPRGVASTAVPVGAPELVAGPGGAIVVLLSAPPAVLAAAVTAPLEQLAMHCTTDSRISGPHWVAVEALPWGAPFRGVPFYACAGFRVVLEEQRFLCAVRFWAAMAGVSCGDHDHSDMPDATRFCEVHLCLHNATGFGGMVCEGVTLPLQQGEEHGAFWSLPDTNPVRYPLHRWQAGPENAGSGPDAKKYDVWAAIEFPPIGVVGQQCLP